MKKLTLEQLRSLINEVLTEGDAPIMNRRQLQELARRLTREQKLEFLEFIEAQPPPPDGRVTLPSGKILALGSGDAAMELNTIVKTRIYLEELATTLTRKEKTEFLNLQPYPPDGRVTLRSGRRPKILDLGSWDNAMEFNTIVLLPQTTGPGRGGLKGRPEWLRRMLGYY
jgi:hypothetical protein